MKEHLYECEDVIGNTVYVKSDPSLIVIDDAVCIPLPNELSYPGIYDFGRKLITQSVYFRGPDVREVAPPIAMLHDYNSIQAYAEDDEYIYIGHIHDHYGHFILSTVSRLWHKIFLETDLKIIYSSTTNFEDQLNKPIVSAVLDATGISRDRFVRFDEPKKLRKVYIPAPAFEESNFAHQVMSDFCNGIGEKIASHYISHTQNVPLFLSKAKLKTGVRKIINEQEIVYELERLGIEVAYPEELNIGEQIALWYNRKNIVAFSGSALHTSLFAPGNRVVSLNYDKHINSSFLLCDTINRSDASYYYFGDGAIQHLGPSSVRNHDIGFSSEELATDPIMLARQIASLF